MIARATLPNSYTVNTLNQYTQTSQVGGTTSYSYTDAAGQSNGNLTSDGTSTYEYDEENRLRKITLSGHTYTYDYDPLGRRARKVVDGTATYFASDGPNEFWEYTSSGATLRFYAPGGSVDDVLYYADYGTGQGDFPHKNHQGSVIQLSSNNTLAASFHYGPYGESGDATTGLPMRYTGQYLDAESGLYYYRARYYSTKIGRFLQTDPIGSKDDLNLYAYTGGDPVNESDPTGTSCRGSAIGDCDSGGNLGAGQTLSSAKQPAADVNGQPPVSGTPQKTGTPGHAEASVKQMNNMVRDAQANGETVDSVYFNKSARKATNGAIDSSLRPDVVVNSTAADGEKVIRPGEVKSPGQSIDSQTKKLAELAKMAPEGTRVIPYVNKFVKGSGDLLGPVGIGVIGYSLVTDPEYHIDSAIGDFFNISPLY